jgi:hypothetical protein
MLKITNRFAKKLGIIRKNKYNNIKVKQDGKKFDSKQEYYKYIDLKNKKANGDIIDFKCQPKYMLMKGFKDLKTGRKIRDIVYIADFEVQEVGGKVTVIDVKSKITVRNPTYGIKRKLFIKKIQNQPNIFFKEIL